MGYMRAGLAPSRRRADRLPRENDTRGNFATFWQSGNTLASKNVSKIAEGDVARRVQRSAGMRRYKRLSLRLTKLTPMRLALLLMATRVKSARTMGRDGEAR